MPLSFSLPRVIGHRGAAEAAPENTLESFREAHRQGARWIEFDVRLAADGQAVLLHDDDLERTTDGKGPVIAQPLAALKALDAGGWFGPAWRDARIPTLDEAAQLIHALGLGANVEIKSSPGHEAQTAQIVMGDLRRLWRGRQDLPLISSFSLDVLRAVKVAAPEFPRGLLLEEHPANWRDLARDLAVVSIHCWDRDMTADWAREIKAAGYGLLVYTVNDAAQARELLAWGIDGIFTDAPGRLLAGLGESLYSGGGTAPGHESHEPGRALRSGENA